VSLSVVPIAALEHAAEKPSRPGPAGQQMILLAWIIELARNGKCWLLHRRYHWPARRGGMCGWELWECRKCGEQWFKVPY